MMCGQFIYRQGMQARTEEEQVLDNVFQQAYIPRSLEEVDEYERDHDRLAGTSIACRDCIAFALQTSSVVIHPPSLRAAHESV